MRCTLYLEALSTDGLELVGQVLCDGLSESPTLTIASQGRQTWTTTVTKLTQAQVKIGVVIQERLNRGLGRCWVSELCKL